VHYLSAGFRGNSLAESRNIVKALSSLPMSIRETKTAHS